MKTALSPRELSLPRYAMRREEAAASLAISPTLFDSWISAGLMPAGRKIGGVVLWDTEEVRQFWCRLRDGEPSCDDKQHPFDGIVA
jgi:predicted DNA-binding transcriptional regulator AlpA